MNFYTNITSVHSVAEAIEAGKAVQKSNAGNLTKRESRYNEAIRLHSEAAQTRIRLHGARSAQAAISFNNLGEVYHEAEGSLREGARGQGRRGFRGDGVRRRNDAAASRDNMARVLEAKGDFAAAREMRVKGADKRTHDVRVL